MEEQLWLARYLAELSGMLSAKTVPHVAVCGSLRDTQELQCAVAQSGGPDLASCVWLGSLLQAFGSDWQASQKWRVIRTQQEMELVRFSRRSSKHALMSATDFVAALSVLCNKPVKQYGPRVAFLSSAAETTKKVNASHVLCVGRHHRIWESFSGCHSAAVHFPNLTGNNNHCLQELVADSSMRVSKK